MRGVLDPKRFYKRSDKEGLPKYFQVPSLAFVTFMLGGSIFVVELKMCGISCERCYRKSGHFLLFVIY